LGRRLSASAAVRQTLAIPANSRIVDVGVITTKAGEVPLRSSRVSEAAATAVCLTYVR
jgi:hypothetical protein